LLAFGPSSACADELVRARERDQKASSTQVDDRRGL